MRSRGVRIWLGRSLFQVLHITLLCLLLIVVIASVGFLAYQARYARRMYQGVRVLGVDVGGLSRQEALDLVEREIGNMSLPYVHLHAGQKEWTISTATLGACLELSDAVQEAWSLGRTGVFRSDLEARAKLLWRGYRVVPEFHIDPGSTFVYLSQIASQAEHPARRAQIWVAGPQARAGESETGRELDIEATREAIECRVRERLGTSSWERTPRVALCWQGQIPSATSLCIDPVAVQVVFRQVLPSLTEVEGSREQASLILSPPLMLTLESEEYQADGQVHTQTRRWCIDQAVLASWIALQPIQTEQGTTFKVGADRVKIGAFLQELADEIARPPREARFDYDPQTNTLTTLTPGQCGHSLDVKAALGQIAEACLSPRCQVALPLHVVPPRVTRADLEHMLPLSLISEGESSFRGSKPMRLQDIRVASARLHGLAVPPQTTFSFLDNLGLVTVANGYSESWIIDAARTIRGRGGGVCQVSTTCFRAAFWGGYPILERWPHIYRVGWCEADGAPAGLDAAAFSPLVDFKFRNDTDAPILVLTEIDENNAKLWFRFYGAPKTREVTIKGPTTSNPIEAGDPIFEEDPSLPPGTRVQVEWPHDGLDVTLYRVIQQDDGQVAREKFLSHYEPWPARYLEGLPRARSRAAP